MSVRSFANALAGLLLTALGLAGCTSGFPSTVGTSSPTHGSVLSDSQIPASSIEPNGVPRVRRFGEGMVTLTYLIEALDPPRHPYDVRIEAPAGTGLEMWMTTPYRATLQVTQDTLQTQACGRQDGRLSCVFHFPALEAQDAGRWTAHVVKRTNRPGNSDDHRSIQGFGVSQS